MRNLQENDFQVLEYFTEYGRLALKETDTDEKPFQKLVFLIRDWFAPKDHPYGLEGGHTLLEKRLAIKDGQLPELQEIRRNIESCFNKINCYLMPPPGKIVANQTFYGTIADIEPEFIDCLKTFVPLMLDPKNVVVKKIGGRQVTGKELMEYFKVYINIFRSN
jgi:atlastin